MAKKHVLERKRITWATKQILEKTFKTLRPITWHRGQILRKRREGESPIFERASTILKMQLGLSRAPLVLSPQCNLGGLWDDEDGHSKVGGTFFNYTFQVSLRGRCCEQHFLTRTWNTSRAKVPKHIQFCFIKDKLLSLCPQIAAESLLDLARWLLIRSLGPEGEGQFTCWLLKILNLPSIIKELGDSFV